MPSARKPAPVSAMAGTRRPSDRATGGGVNTLRGNRRVKFADPLAASSVAAHPDLLSVPTFVLFVQPDELAMARAEARKEERKEAQRDFESWLVSQTAPRAPQQKKQMMSEETSAPVDDKERGAVAARMPGGGPNKPGGKQITRPSSDGFRVGGGPRPMGPAPQARAWNSQRGPRVIEAAGSPPPRSRAMTIADTLSDPAHHATSNPTAAASGPNGHANGALDRGRSPTRKTPTPRGTPRNGTGPPRGAGINGRPKTPTPRAGGKSPTPRPRTQTPTKAPSPHAHGGRFATPPKRPPSARKPASNRGGTHAQQMAARVAV